MLVEGANRVKKHTKQGQSARGSQTGGIVETEAPHPRQQRRLRSPEDRQAGTARATGIDDDGKKVRVCRSGGNEVDV